MKRAFICILTALLSALAAMAQDFSDVIVKLDGSYFECTITDVTSDSIGYEFAGKKGSIPSSEVDFILYKDGTKKQIRIQENKTTVSTNTDKESTDASPMVVKPSETSPRTNVPTEYVYLDQYNPTFCGVLSFIVPGLGSFAANDNSTGWTYLGTALVATTLTGVFGGLAATAVTPEDFTTYSALAGTSAGLFLVVDVASIISAVKTAKHKNHTYRDVRIKR